MYANNNNNNNNHHNPAKEVAMYNTSNNNNNNNSTKEVAMDNTSNNNSNNTNQKNSPQTLYVQFLTTCLNCGNLHGMESEEGASEYGMYINARGRATECLCANTCTETATAPLYQVTVGVKMVLQTHHIALANMVYTALTGNSALAVDGFAYSHVQKMVTASKLLAQLVANMLDVTYMGAPDDYAEGAVAAVVSWYHQKVVQKELAVAAVATAAATKAQHLATEALLAM